jgi:hypothetical protein
LHRSLAMRVSRRLASVIALAFSASCTGSKAPTEPSTISADRLVEGMALSAVDGSGTAGVNVQVETAHAVTTDGAGYFRTEIDRTGTLGVVFSGSSIVERRTSVNGPTSGRARLSLIPSSFDLRAFDEMFRTANGRLQRWTSRPSLVVIATVMAYRNPDDQYMTTGEQMTDEEVAALVQHLTEGLTLLTGSTYTSFADVSIERPPSGMRVLVIRPGAVVVGRYNGIQTFASTIGYGRWAEDASGAVTGGSMFLDRGFDHDDSRRRLLRIHELGHALGYLHVETRTSIMNPAIGPEPTEFDRTAAIVAFQRQPGNVSPDTDPQGIGGNPFGPRETMWMAPVACLDARTTDRFCVGRAGACPRDQPRLSR